MTAGILCSGRPCDGAPAVFYWGVERFAQRAFIAEGGEKFAQRAFIAVKNFLDQESACPPRLNGNFPSE